MHSPDIKRLEGHFKKRVQQAQRPGGGKVPAIAGVAKF